MYSTRYWVEYTRLFTGLDILCPGIGCFRQSIQCIITFSEFFVLFPDFGKRLVLRCLFFQHNIGHFFDKVSKLKRIVNIADLSINVEKAKGSGPSKPKLNSKFKAITFKFIEKDTSSVKKKRKRK